LDVAPLLLTQLDLASGHSTARRIFADSNMVHLHREMCLWDLSDGRCLEHTRMSCIHTSIQVMHSTLNRKMNILSVILKP